jgi:hypothetical protein
VDELEAEELELLNEHIETVRERMLAGGFRVELRMP